MGDILTAIGAIIIVLPIGFGFVYLLSWIIVTLGEASSFRKKDSRNGNSNSKQGNANIPPQKTNPPQPKTISTLNSTSCPPNTTSPKASSPATKSQATPPPPPTGSDLSKTVFEQKKEIDRLRGQVKNLETQIKPIDAVRKECEAEQRQLEIEHDRVVSHLEKQLADARKQPPSASPSKSLDDAKREWEAEQHKKNKAKEQTIANQKRIIDRQENELGELRQKYNAAQKEISKFKSYPASANQAILPSKSSTYDFQYVDNLKKELSKAKEASANLNSQRKALAQEKNEFYNEKNRFQKELDNFNKDKKSFEQACELYISEKSKFDIEKTAFDQNQKQFEEIYDAVRSAADAKGTPYNSILNIFYLLRNPMSIPKFDKACSGAITPIEPISVSCQIKPSNQTEKPYITSLTSCTCRSFTGERDQAPCKHMIWLALRMGAYILSENDKNLLVMELKEKTDGYISAFDNYKQESNKQQKKEQKLNEKIEIIRSAEIRHPELARILSSYDMHVEQCREKILKTKKNPAIRAADTIQEVNQEKNKLRKEFNMLQAHLDFYETYFPWLQHFLDLPIDMARKCASEINSDSVIADHIMSHFNDYSS